MSLEHHPSRSRPQGGTARRRPVPLWAPDDYFVSREEAAKFLGLSPSQLAHDAVSGRLGIPYFRFGQRARYKISELRAWAEAQRRAGA